MTTLIKKKVKVIDRIKSSQIGMFMKLVEKDVPIEEFTCLSHLAKHISAEFDVICEASDLERYLALENNIVNDNYEVESKIIEYGI